MSRKTEAEAQWFTLERDDQPDIRFRGWKIGEASTSPDSGHYSYSGSAGRWSELTLYRSVGGRMVCHLVERTQWQGGRDSYACRVVSDEEGVIGFFGHGPLAKQLYDDAEIDDLEEIE